MWRPPARAPGFPVTARRRYAIGVLSGTSADGIDVAVVGDAGHCPRIVAAQAIPYRRRTRLLLARGPELDPAGMARLHRLVADDFALAVAAVLKRAGVKAAEVAVIGSHGQTVWHIPRVMSLQIGSPAILAAVLGIPVAADFRPDDIAVGGEGAPFAPVLDRMLLGALSRGALPERMRGGTRRLGALNLGGISNLTVVAKGEVEAAWDLGPANGPLDVVARGELGRSCDRDARVALRGRVDRTLLSRALRHPYFQKRAPKSTGLEEFGEAFVRGLRASRRTLSTADLLATLVELSALTTARELAKAGLETVYVSGGGWHNPLLRQRLVALASPVILRSAAELGIDPDFKEAVLFAVLGWKRLQEEPVDLRAVTGATRPKILGGLWLP